MGLSRRFLNLIMDSSFRGAKSLRCVALTRRLFCEAATPPSRNRNGSESFLNLVVDRSFPGTALLRRLDLRSHLFSNTATPPSTIGEESESVVQDTASQIQAADSGDLKNKLEEVAAAKMEWIQLPGPSFTFRATHLHYSIDCFPLTDRKVVITDNSVCTVLFDADMSLAVPMPNLHKHKKKPISLFVPSAEADDHLNGGGNLYIFESIPKPEVAYSMLSDQFEVMVCEKPTETSPCQSAYCRQLPPPPFVRDPAYKYPYPRITAYAVVGSDICISAERAGTYHLDTISNTWNKLGSWTLPFYGKVEYVPEFQLWFGISTEDGLLSAADLSDIESQPQLVDIDCQKEVDPPKEWMAAHDSQLVNLGSGRFCITRFFQTISMDGDSVADVNQILVLTGVEVMPPVFNGSCSGSDGGTGKLKLEIRKHKSRCHMSRCTSILSMY